MKTTLHHPTLGDVTLSRTARARRISLSVRPSGEVRLSFPTYVSERRAVAFLEAKTEWVEAARRRFASRTRPPQFTKEQIEASNQYYKTGSIAERAQMVQRYNEKNEKKK